MKEILDYNEKYSEQIEEEETKNWGQWDKSHIKDIIDNYDIFKIVLKDSKYAGHLYGKFIGDLFYFDIILIKEEFRNQKLGQFLLSNLIKELKSKKIKNIATTAEYIKNSITLEPLLLKFEFNKIIDIKGFWGSLYPNVYCKDCNSKPCKCKAAVFIKNL